MIKNTVDMLAFHADIIIETVKDLLTLFIKITKLEFKVTYSCNLIFIIWL